jgi:type I restriction enzyme, S subunit
MDVLLSFKPKYVRLILEGKKRFEFRKSIFRKRPVGRIFIYASAPVQRVVASFESGRILEDHPALLWDQVRDHAGIRDSEFLSCFAGTSRGYAIEIGDLQVFDKPIDPKEVIPGFVPPQSYCYLDGLSLGASAG